MQHWILPFSDISLADLPAVGGKTASLGELIRHLGPADIRVPEGFAITAQAYWDFLAQQDPRSQQDLRSRLGAVMARLDTEDFSNLQRIGAEARAMIRQTPLPELLSGVIAVAFEALAAASPQLQVAVRSSATAEDLPDASFAGQQESFLNIRSLPELLEACRDCYASLYTDRAIKYRHDHGFAHDQVALSIAVQRMVRADKASAGVCFTLDPESGHEQVILVTGSWGLGENVVQGAVDPDEFYVFKPGLEAGNYPIISRRLGSKALTMICAEDTPLASRSPHGLSRTIVNRVTPRKQQARFVLSDSEVTQLARWCLSIERHYGRPMDIEWAKDGFSGEIYIVQARPETVHSHGRYRYHAYTLRETGQILARGKNIGDRIAAGKARILHSPAERDQLAPGEVLVTGMTNPDWDPILKKAAAIVTDKGGRTSHAAIVARETGAVAVVGTGNGTRSIHDGQEVTVVCCDGQTGLVYAGRLAWDEREIDPAALKLPERTQMMLILADPGQAFKLARLPSAGVGLMRIEFAISNAIQIHPMALVRYPKLADTSAVARIAELTKGYTDKQQYFVDKLAEAVATIAAAFWPREVIVRMSDFKSNEYADLIGGREFEPAEANPMLGFRGAARYAHERYREGFALECRAMQTVRETMGLSNVKLMIPFCRSLREADQVLATMADFGLRRGEKGLEIYVMCEIPSNVVLAEDFAERFDGFSIGSNDLTQLSLGIDRDSELLLESFDEQDPAVKKLIAQAIQAAHAKGIKIGLCGQAPSDHPAFARFLVEAGIDSISFNPDALLKGIENVTAAESSNEIMPGPRPGKKHSRPKRRHETRPTGAEYSSKKG